MKATGHSKKLCDAFLRSRGVPETLLWLELREISLIPILCAKRIQCCNGNSNESSGKESAGEFYLSHSIFLSPNNSRCFGMQGLVLPHHPRGCTPCAVGTRGARLITHHLLIAPKFSCGTLCSTTTAKLYTVFCFIFP